MSTFRNAPTRLAQRLLLFQLQLQLQLYSYSYIAFCVLQVVQLFDYYLHCCYCFTTYMCTHTFFCALHCTFSPHCYCYCCFVISYAIWGGGQALGGRDKRLKRCDNSILLLPLSLFAFVCLSLFTFVWEIRKFPNNFTLELSKRYVDRGRR